MPRHSRGWTAGLAVIAVVATLTACQRASEHATSSTHPDAATARSQQAVEQEATESPDDDAHRVAGEAANAASAFMPALRTAADNGNARAACQLAFALNTCAGMNNAELSLTLGGDSATDESRNIDQLAATEASCRDAVATDLDARYRYQAMAADRGGAAAERWFLQRPMLSESEFLNNTARAVDFRRRANAYVQRALQRRSADDLPMLLRVYWPDALGASASRYRVRDDAMFLVLAEAAQNAGLADKPLMAVAAQLRRAATPQLRAAQAQRQATFGGQWSAPTAGTDDASAESAFDDLSCDAL